MKIAIVTDPKTYDSWLDNYQLRGFKNLLKVVFRERDINGSKFDYFHKIYSHIDASNAISYLQVLGVPEILTIDDLKELLNR